MADRKLTPKEIERRLRIGFSGLFARGEVDPHDRQLVEQWIKRFVEMHLGGEKEK